MVFQVLRASLCFSNEPLSLPDWESVFNEMKVQAVAALPEVWLKTNLPSAKLWLNYCAQKQGQWVRVMHGQDQLLQLFTIHNIPCVIIKGAAAAMAYPHPSLRSMGDVDVLVKRCDLDKAAELMESNGYSLEHEKNEDHHHYGYKKDKISFELHWRLGIVEDEKLLTLFEDGIDNRHYHTIGSYRFPTLPPLLNGLSLLFHINQHLRSGLGLRQIVDWMMYVHSLQDDQWQELLDLLKSVDMERLALTTTAMCQRYLGLPQSFPGTESVDPRICEELMSFIMEKGNFGCKSGETGKIASVYLDMSSPLRVLKRLQAGGLCRWNAAKKHPILRPFAWIYQIGFITRELIKNRIGAKDMIKQRGRGLEQRKLIEDLGLRVDRTVQYGKSIPSDEFLSAVSREFNVSNLWLRTGEADERDPLDERFDRMAEKKS